MGRGQAKEIAHGFSFFKPWNILWLFFYYNEREEIT